MSSIYVLPHGCIVVNPATPNPAFLQVVWNVLPASASQKTEEEATRDKFTYMVDVLLELKSTIEENKWSPLHSKLRPSLSKYMWTSALIVSPTTQT